MKEEILKYIDEIYIGNENVCTQIYTRPGSADIDAVFVYRNEHTIRPALHLFSGIHHDVITTMNGMSESEINKIILSAQIKRKEQEIEDLKSKLTC